jgi:hypothetical protein
MRGIVRAIDARHYAPGWRAGEHATEGRAD